MRKEITVPVHLLPDLKMLAFHAKKPVKQFMEDIINSHIIEYSKKLSGYDRNKFVGK